MPESEQEFDRLLAEAVEALDELNDAETRYKACVWDVWIASGKRPDIQREIAAAHEAREARQKEAEDGQ